MTKDKVLEAIKELARDVLNPKIDFNQVESRKNLALFLAVAYDYVLDSTDKPTNAIDTNLLN